MEITLTGRKRIYIPKQEINNETLPKILSRAMAIHLQNASHIDYLWNYYKGDQPILKRVKKIRPEINNKIVCNHAYEIATFTVGYTFGDPIQYVQKGKFGKEEGYSNVNNVSILNEFMALDNKASKDKELGEWQKVVGTAYRMTLPSLNPCKIFDTEILDPRVSFVVYDTGFGKEPWLCVTFNIKHTKKGFEYYALYGYTKDLCFQCEEFNRGYRNINIEAHVLNYLPIVEYPSNMAMLGCFEPVVGIMDAINTMESNRADGVEQFVQHFMKFVNVDIDDKDFDKLKEKGLIKIKVPQGMKGDVDVVTVQLDQVQTQSYVDSLYQKMLQIAGVPDRNASAGGNTGQALIIGQGWSNAEARAKDTELMFKLSEFRFLELVLRIIKDYTYAPEELKALNIYDIDTKFTRNKTDSLLVKAQGLLNLLEAGVHPRIAFQCCGLFNDPEQAYVDSQPYLNAKWLRDLKSNVDKKEITSEEDVLPKLPVTG